jgi:hypothetical protein
MSDDVFKALILTAGTVITALLGYLGIITTATRRHARAARDQVQNSHPTNLRDDLDEKFRGLTSLVTTAVRDIGGIKSDIREVRREAADDRRHTLDALRIERERINKIEDAKAVAVAEVAEALRRSQHKE